MCVGEIYQFRAQTDMEGLDWAKRLNKKAYLHVSLLPPSLWSKKSDLFYSAFFLGGT